MTQPSVIGALFQEENFQIRPPYFNGKYFILKNPNEAFMKSYDVKFGELLNLVSYLFLLQEKL